MRPDVVPHGSDGVTLVIGQDDVADLATNDGGPVGLTVGWDIARQLWHQLGVQLYHWDKASGATGAGKTTTWEAIGVRFTAVGPGTFPPPLRHQAENFFAGGVWKPDTDMTFASWTVTYQIPTANGPTTWTCGDYAISATFPDDTAPDYAATICGYVQQMKPGKDTTYRVDTSVGVITVHVTVNPTGRKPST